jgi:hypothetical protein
MTVGELKAHLTPFDDDTPVKLLVRSRNGEVPVLDVFDGGGYKYVVLSDAPLRVEIRPPADVSL